MIVVFRITKCAHHLRSVIPLANYENTSAHQDSLILMAHARLIHRGLLVFNEVLALLGTRQALLTV